MPVKLREKKNFYDPVIFHLVVTAKCQGKCKGCINTLSERDRKKLLSLWETDPYKSSEIILNLIKSFNLENGVPIYIAFYGGEPLLELEKVLKIKEILSKHYKFFYILYTNGLLLRNLIKYNSKVIDFKFINISIDGREEQHNRVRKGIDYKKIYLNLKEFKRKFKTIPIIMWSTLRENQSFKDCIDAFLQLHDEGLVNYFFWHFLETEEPFIDFENFYFNYSGDLEYLLEIYINSLKEGKILPILPLNELIYFKLVGEKRKTTACKVELMRNFDVVNDKVVPCIDLPLDFYFARIDEKKRLDFKNKDEINDFFENLMKYKKVLSCSKCKAHYYCGGRCPVQAVSSLERTKNYCELTRLFVKKVEDRFIEIKPLIEKNITAENFYEEFVFPVHFTDVVP